MKVALSLLFGYFRELPPSSYQPGLMSELLFGRPEPWLSYFSNVPDLSVKTVLVATDLFVGFLQVFRMIISQQSELERC